MLCQSMSPQNTHVTYVIIKATTKGSLKTHIQSVHKKISSCLVTRMNKVICVIMSE